MPSPKPMPAEKFSEWTHEHVFDPGSRAAEKGTRLVMWITAVVMVLEILAGWWYNSMALLADGWHMSSHAFALGLSAFAYAAARRYATDRRFAFGTWKIEILGGFTSAMFLLGVAAVMVIGSVERFLAPQAIQYREAIIVAVIGLVTNLVCALILRDAHHHHDGHGHHGHEQGHDQPHHHSHEDLNLKSAYLHVIADAATSVLAIIALAGGWMYGWDWLDPAMGIVGAILVGRWARGLLIDTGKVLLDREMDHPVVEEIREAVETSEDTRIVDLHVWRVGKGCYSCALCVATHDRTLTPARIRERLAVHGEIVHSTIEIQHCPAEGSTVS